MTTAAQALWDLLRPLGPYGSGGKFTLGELKSEGAALDGAEGELAELEREAFLDTAESWGLERLESLLTRRPVTETPQGKRLALAALLRINGDSFTLEALNRNLRGCGLNALVSETGETGVVEVCFPDVAGIPDGFEQLKKIIEDILPAHLEISYKFWYATWAQIEARFPTWGDLEAAGPTWEELEKLVK